MLPWISVIVIGVWVAAAMTRIVTKPHHQMLRLSGRSNAPNESGAPMPPEFKQLQDAYQKNIMASLNDGECKKERLTIRRSWSVNPHPPPLRVCHGGWDVLRQGSKG